MKMDYLFWVVAVLLLGFAAFRAARSERPRERIVWLCGALIGIVAYLPAHFTLGGDAGMAGWSAAVLLQTIAGPLSYVAVDLTSPLWGPLTLNAGLLGLWAVVALTGCLYHGPIAVWLGRVYRRRPVRAMAMAAALLGLHLAAFLAWQSLPVRGSEVEQRAEALHTR